MWEGLRPVSGILEMELYPGTESDVCTSAFATSVSVSDKT